MDFGDTAVQITVDGRVYTIDLADLTGEQTNAFRLAVGISPAQALATGLDLDCVAAFVWLERRKTEKALNYRDIAKGITWRDVEFDETGEVEEPADSPEA